jgi:hypothetical protein
LLIDGCEDLGILGEAVPLPLGEGKPAVDDDFEDASSRRDELRGDAVTLLDPGRQTCGAWLVVSDLAVLYRDLHG